MKLTRNRVLLLLVAILVVGAFLAFRSYRAREKRRIEGQVELNDKSQARVFAVFSNGIVRVTYGEPKVIRWTCEVQGSASDPTKPFPFKGESKLDLSDFDGVDCDLTLPDSQFSSITGDNGQVLVHAPKSNVEVALGNGQIRFYPGEFSPYRFQNSLKNGSSVPNSESADAILISLSVENGQLYYGKEE